MEKIEKVVACLKELGITLDISDKEKRMIIQKTVCLLQLGGLRIGYPFSIYINGPYSRELTQDYYEENKTHNNSANKIKLSEEETTILKKFSDIFDIKKTSLLEISSTYGHYMRNRNYSPVEAMKATREIKSQYSSGQLAVGISKANQFLYSPTPDDLQLLKEETAHWQEIGFLSLESAE